MGIPEIRDADCGSSGARRRGSEPGAKWRLIVSNAGRKANAAFLDGRKARGLHHSPEPRGIWLPPPRAADSVKRRERAPRMHAAQGWVDRVAEEERASRDRADAGQRLDGISQVEKQAPEVDEVELSDDVGREVVGAQLVARDP